MSEDDEKEERIKKIVKASTKAGAAGLSLLGSGGALAGLGLTVFGEWLLKEAIEGGEVRRARVLVEMERAFHEGGGDPADAVQGDDEREAIFEMFRRSMDAISSEAIPAMARLTAEMVRAGGPNALTRSIGRLLQDVTKAELEAIRGMVTFPDMPGLDIPETVLFGVDPADGPSIRWMGNSPRPLPLQLTQDELEAAVSLLLRHGLLRRPDVGAFDGLPGTLASADISTLRRLRRLLSPERLKDE